MNSESQPDSRLPTPDSRAHCSICHGTGWKSIFKDGVSSVIECDCRRKSVSGESGVGSRGFETAGTILRESVPLGAGGSRESGFLPNRESQIATPLLALTPNDKKIAALIQARVGRINAIRGRELAEAVWPKEMANPAKYESAVRRWLEESISRLRRFGKLMIAASKTPPMGYYIPSTAEECDEVHDRLFGEGIERIKDSQLFRFDRDLVERLRGQLELQEVGSGK